MASPRINIDLLQVEGLIRLGCPVAEIADYLGVSATTLRHQLKKRLAKARATRQMKLREFQWSSAKGGNATMLIFLGKAELGQGKAIQ